MTGTVLSRRVEATPDRLAIIESDTGNRWSYRDLSEQVTRVAERLVSIVGAQQDGVQSENPMRIGTLFHPSADFTFLFHAIRRLGWTQIGLETSQSREQLTARIEQTEPTVVFCSSETETQAKAAVEGESVVFTVNNWEGQLLEEASDSSRNRENESNRVHSSADTETALILFTSGTTGEPKAVRLTAENLTASAEASAYRLGLTGDDRWLDCLPVAHMGGIAPILRTAQYGTTLVIQPAFDAIETANVIHEYEVTGISLVPTQLRRLLAADSTVLTSLEAVLVGGAPASESLLERADNAGVPVYPTYGLTETASQVATARPEQVREHPSTVGQPLYGTRVRIVDGEMPVESGQRGEIVVSGPTVTPGYLDEDTSAAAFSEHGFHTGDVGYRDEDGRLFVEGRLDDLIQTGGELVAPDTVVAVLDGHPAVSEAAVVGVTDAEWGERVSAVLVADDTGETALKEYCRERLASYEVPKTFVFVESLPRTVSGTIERKAVRSLVREQTSKPSSSR